MSHPLSIRGGRRLTWLTALLWLVYGSVSAQQSQPQSRVQMPQQVVRGKGVARVVVVAALDLRERSLQAISTIRGQLAGLRVTMLVEWVEKLEVTLPGQVRVAREIARRTGAQMVLWADLSLPDQIFVYLGRGDSGRILVRSVRSEGSHEGRVEAMSLIVRSSVAALAAGATIGLLPPPAVRAAQPALLPHSQPSQAPVALPVPRRSLLSASLGYGLFGFGSQLSDGAQLGVSGYPRRWLRLGLSLRILRPVQAQTPSARVVFERYPVGLDGAFRWGGHRLDFEVGAGLWLERMAWSVSVQRPGLQPVAESARWLVIGQFVGGVCWRLLPTASSCVRLGVDLPNDTRSFEIDGPTNERLATPWPLQPWVLVGFQFTLL